MICCSFVFKALNHEFWQWNKSSFTKIYPRLIIDTFLCGIFFFSISLIFTPKPKYVNPLNKPFTFFLKNNYWCVSSGPLVMSGYPSRTWQHESQPQFWSKFQVWEWLQQVMDIHQIDASSIPLQNFDMDGHQLCNLSYQDFLRAAGSVGPILFHSITELKWSGTSVRPTAPCGALKRDD